MKTKVLIIDDSALIRRVLTDIIGRAPDMTVVGAAPDPLIAREMIKQTDPDVLTLDIEMPRMDGLEFLERLMRLRPTPVVMVSTLTRTGADATLRALELGAVDFVAKPTIDVARGVGEYAGEILAKIRAAAKAKLPSGPRPDPGSAPPKARRPLAIGTEKLIAIGASTGGTEAIAAVLAELPPDSPGVLITQHMPAGFTQSFAARLDRICQVRVSEASDGERILPGHVYLAPGGLHLALGKSGANYVARVTDDEPVNRHRPSVDVLFRSVARHAGPNAVGIMLTGMGKDGAAGMLEMREQGAFTIAQDEASCVVFGMPREAIHVGAVSEVLTLTAIADRALAHISSASRHTIRM